jgi:hypothetical protein
VAHPRSGVVPVPRADPVRGTGRYGEQRRRSRLGRAVRLAAHPHRPHAIANLHRRPVPRHDVFNLALRLAADRVDQVLHVAVIEDAGDQCDRAEVDLSIAKRLEQLRVPADASRDLDPAPGRRGRVAQVPHGEVEHGSVPERQMQSTLFDLVQMQQDLDGHLVLVARERFDSREQLLIRNPHDHALRLRVLV